MHVTHKVKIGISPAEMQDGDVGVIVSWSTVQYVGEVVQAFNNELISIGKRSGQGWANRAGLNRANSPTCLVQVLNPPFTLSFEDD